MGRAAIGHGVAIVPACGESGGDETGQSEVSVADPHVAEPAGVARQRGGSVDRAWDTVTGMDPPNCLAASFCERVIRARRSSRLNNWHPNHPPAFGPPRKYTRSCRLIMAPC